MRPEDVWSAAYRALSDVVAKGVMFGVTVAVAHRLTREAAGLFAVATTLGWIGAVVADFGIQMHLARSVAHRPERAAVSLGAWLPVRIVSAGITLVVAFGLMALSGISTGLLIPLGLFAAAYAAMGLCELLYYLFRGLGRSDLESSLTVVNRLLLGAFAGLALWLRPGLTSLGIAMALPAIVTLVAALVQTRALLGRLPTAESWPTLQEFIRSVAPIGIGIVLSALYFRIDIFLLERWRGAEDVGVYNAVFRLVEALRLVPAAIVAVALPRLCQAADTHVVARVGGWMSAGASVIAIVLWPVAGWVVPAVYGPQYADGTSVLRVLLLSFPLMSLNYALTSQLIGWNGQRAFAALCAGALVVNVTLNARLIPDAGMAGAAWATLWTEAFLTVGCVLALARASVSTGDELPEPAMEVR